MFENIAFGFCGWDIPAAIALVVSIAVLIVQQHRHKKKMNALRGPQNVAEDYEENTAQVSQN